MPVPTYGYISIGARISAAMVALSSLKHPDVFRFSDIVFKRGTHLEVTIYLKAIINTNTNTKDISRILSDIEKVIRLVVESLAGLKVLEIDIKTYSLLIY